MGCMKKYSMEDFYEEVRKKKTGKEHVDYLAQYLDDSNNESYQVHRFEGGCACCAEGFYPQVGTVVFYVPVKSGEEKQTAPLLGAMVEAATGYFDFMPYHSTIYLFDSSDGREARKFLEEQGLLTTPFEIYGIAPSDSLKMEEAALPKTLTAASLSGPVSCSRVLLDKAAGLLQEGFEWKTREVDALPVSDGFAAVCEGVPCALLSVGTAGCSGEDEKIEMLDALVRGMVMEENPGYYVFLTEGRQRFCLGCTKAVGTLLIVGALGSYDYRLYENKMSESDFWKVFEAASDRKLSQARELLAGCLPEEAARGKGQKMGPMRLADAVHDIWVDEIHWVRDMIPLKREGAFAIRRNQELK